MKKLWGVIRSRWRQRVYTETYWGCTCGSVGLRACVGLARPTDGEADLQTRGPEEHSGGAVFLEGFPWAPASPSPSATLTSPDIPGSSLFPTSPHCAGTSCFFCLEHSLPLTVTLTSKPSFNNFSLINPQTWQGSLPSSLLEPRARSAWRPASSAWL